LAPITPHQKTDRSCAPPSSSQARKSSLGVEKLRLNSEALFVGPAGDGRGWLFPLRARQRITSCPLSQGNRGPRSRLIEFPLLPSRTSGRSILFDGTDGVASLRHLTPTAYRGLTATPDGTPFSCTRELVHLLGGSSRNCKQSLGRLTFFRRCSPFG